MPPRCRLQGPVTLSTRPQHCVICPALALSSSSGRTSSPSSPSSTSSTRMGRAGSPRAISRSTWRSCRQRRSGEPRWQASGRRISRLGRGRPAKSRALAQPNGWLQSRRTSRTLAERISRLSPSSRQSGGAQWGQHCRRTRRREGCCRGAAGSTLRGLPLHLPWAAAPLPHPLRESRPNHLAPRPPPTHKTHSRRSPLILQPRSTRGLAWSIRRLIVECRRRL